MTEKVKISDLPIRQSISEKDIFIESDNNCTYKVTAEDIASFVVDSDIMKNKYINKSVIATENGVVPLNSDKKIDGAYIQYGNTINAAYEGSSGATLEKNLDNHLTDVDAHGYQTKIDSISKQIAEIVDNNIDYSIATSSTAGIVKLYDTIGNNTDGTMTQASVKGELDKKSNINHTHDLSTVAKSGSYNDLIDKPIIPEYFDGIGQIISDSEPDKQNTGDHWLLEF